MQAHGPWKIVQSHDIYADPWIHVRMDDVVRPDGKPGIHSVITLKPGVTVLAMDEAGVYLTEEFHYGVGRRTVEAVSGGIDIGEDAPTCARRELREELGIEAADWVDLGSVDPFTTNVVSPTRLYLARKLTHGASSPEGTEHIRRLHVPFSAALAMVMDGRISHGPTCVVLLKTAVMQERSNTRNRPF
jgi:ADP-ribose pyrophosphatase